MLFVRVGFENDVDQCLVVTGRQIGKVVSIAFHFCGNGFMTARIATEKSGRGNQSAID